MNTLANKIWRFVTRSVFLPFIRLYLQTAKGKDPWCCIPAPLPGQLFSSGCDRDFSWFLQGESRVESNSIADVCVWLIGCEYISDQEQFRKADHWLHPKEFEISRKGDCEDHALWAWSRLIALGYKTEFIAGTNIQSGCRHAWIHVSLNDQTALLEATSKNPETIILSMDEVRERYRPEFGVDQNLNTYIYGGGLLYMNKILREGK